MRRTSDRRLPAPAALAAGASINALLGLVGYIPYTFSMILLSGIAGELGWARPTQHFRDGYWQVFLTVFAVWAVFLPIVIFTNRALLKRSRISPRSYWAVCLPLLLLPSCVAAIMYGFFIP